MTTPAVQDRADSPASSFSDLRRLTLDQLAADGEAARIVARITRKTTAAEPVRVAAFNSYI